jgi:hypothetical protein
MCNIANLGAMVLGLHGRPSIALQNCRVIEADASIKADACKVLVQIGTKQSPPAPDQIVEANRRAGKMKGNHLYIEAGKAVNSINACDL